MGDQYSDQYKRIGYVSHNLKLNTEKVTIFYKKINRYTTGISIFLLLHFP